jgi:hypothetical protein
MTEEELKAILRPIDLKLLLKLAEQRGISLPANAPKGSVIDVLAHQLPNSALDPTRAVIQLELEDLERRLGVSWADTLRNRLDERLPALKGDLERRFSDLKGDLERRGQRC